MTSVPVMPGMVYRINYIDHGGHLFATEHVEHDDEDALIVELRPLRAQHRAAQNGCSWPRPRLGTLDVRRP